MDGRTRQHLQHWEGHSPGERPWEVLGILCLHPVTFH